MQANFIYMLIIDAFWPGQLYCARSSYLPVADVIPAQNPGIFLRLIFKMGLSVAGNVKYEFCS